jgi:thioredoxin 1
MPDLINDLDIFKEKIKSPNLTIVDFTATWCGPCRIVGPKFDTLSVENPNYNFYKVDVDDGEEIAQMCDIQCMPTFKFYKNGELLGTVTGNNIEDVKTMITTHA